MAKKVLEALRGRRVVIESRAAEGLGVEGVPLSDMDVDVIITVGGDGTILRTLQGNDAPVMGVNAGVLGFLTEVQPKDVKEAIRRLLKGDYRVVRRVKLKIVLDGRRLKDATNEAVIHTAHISKMRYFEISVDGTRAMDMRADGIIVATPVGSTCYAMSVGSAIIDPRVDALVIAPIAPFRLAARPLVVPARSKIALTITDPKECIMVIDGQEEVEMTGREKVVFTASEKKARFVTLQSDFYKNLEEKLVASAPHGARSH